MATTPRWVLTQSGFQELPFEVPGTPQPCDHCWHEPTGVLAMFVPFGHIVQECGMCKMLRTVPAERTCRCRR